MTGLFFELIRVAIGAQETLSRLPSHSTGSGLTPAEWEELFEMAEKQSLIGVCFVGIHALGADSDEGYINIGMSEDLYFDWMGMAAQINMKNEQVNRQCVELQKRLEAEGFRSSILKGQGIAALYRLHENDNENENCCQDGPLHPKPSTINLSGFRQSGDIDVWIDASKEKVIDYVMGLVPTKEFDQKHIHYHCFEDTEVEVHWFPSMWENPRHNRILHAYFDCERERQFAYRSNGLCVPTSDFQVVHQLLHVYRHYVYEGVGLRQMMDLYFAQLACAACSEGSVERAKYGEVLGLFRRLGLLRFVATTQWVLQEVFGMPEGVLLCAPDAKEGQKLLDEIMIGGNFGHHDERNHVARESLVRRFLRRWGRKFRMFRFDPLGTLLMPLSRLKLELWMRRVRRKYNV